MTFVINKSATVLIFVLQFVLWVITTRLLVKALEWSWNALVAKKNQIASLTREAQVS